MLDDVLFLLANRPLQSAVQLVVVTLGVFVLVQIPFVTVLGRWAESWPRVALSLTAGLPLVGLVVGHVASDYGSLERAYRLDGPEGPRVALVYGNFVSKGVDTCRIRVVEAATGALVSQEQIAWRSACDAVGAGGGRFLWLEEAVGWLSDHDRDFVAIDLYRGERALSVGDALERAHVSGDFRLAASQESGRGLAIELQDGSIVVVAPDVGLAPGPAQPDPVSASALDVTLEDFEAPGVHRAQRILSTCGCQEGACGALITFSDTAFGDGERFLGLHDGGALRWKLPWRDLFGDSPGVAAALDEGGECLLVSGGEDVSLVTLARGTGSVTSILTP